MDFVWLGHVSLLLFITLYEKWQSPFFTVILFSFLFRPWWIGRLVVSERYYSRTLTAFFHKTSVVNTPFCSLQRPEVDSLLLDSKGGHFWKEGWKKVKILEIKVFSLTWKNAESGPLTSIFCFKSVWISRAQRGLGSWLKAFSMTVSENINKNLKSGPMQATKTFIKFHVYLLM